MNNTAKINEFINDSIEKLNDYQKLSDSFKLIIVKTALCPDAPNFSDFYNKFISRDLKIFSNAFEIKQIKTCNDKKLLNKVTKLKEHADKLIKTFDALKKKYEYMFTA